MRTPVTDGRVLNRILPSALHAYASAHGWGRIGMYAGGNVVLAKNGARNIVIPKDPAFADYAEVVHTIILTWALDEGRSEAAILRDLLQVDRDVIRIRALHAEQDGSVAIEAGVSLFHNAREMLLAAACAAREPKRSYRIGSHKEAQEYIGNVRLGQTEQGSYVITLYSPVPSPKEDETPLVASDPSFRPFERMVTSTLVSSLMAAHNTARNMLRSVSSASFDHAVHSGVNANLCDALASLIDDGQGVDVSVAWSPMLPVGSDATHIKFEHAEADVLREGAAYLRSSEPHDIDGLQGYVSALGRDQNHRNGHVTLKAFVEEKLVSVKVDLSASDYEKALDAHKNRKSISAGGHLEKVGQRWHLINVRNFTIIDDFEEMFG